MITITAEQIERVNLILSSVPGGIEKALSSTIRRANNTVRSETLKGITTVYAITRQNVRAETTIKVRTQSSDGGIVGTVLFAGHKIPLYRFNVSPTIPIQRATVSAAVLAGNGRTPFQDAFIARMQSGHTFTKNETEIELTLATPLTADDMVTKGIMSVVRQIPAGAKFTVEVCNNGNDASPTWEDVTQNVVSGSKFFLSNTTKTASAWGYNFRIKVKRGTATGDCFITSAGGNFE